MIVGRVGEATPVGITQNTAILPEPEIAGTKSASLITNPFQTGRNASRIEVIHELPEHELTCVCGCRKHAIGEEVSEPLEIVPMQI